MIKIDSKTVFECVKTGDKDGKAWAIGEIKSSDPTKDFRKAVAFINNADEVMANHFYQVDKILNVTISKRKYTGKDGVEKWIDAYTLNVIVSPANPDAKIAGFSKIEDDIPF